ncbi:succinyldiaminopimelate transaminase [Micrococcales bacterium 31B]|nr:succinyldiaminopimelate transaminase [Micrococcales bacterium 31B]
MTPTSRRGQRTPLHASLPDFPWDSLAAAKTRAGEHPGGIVDLSVGTPVDDTPAVLQEALAAAANSHGYPTTIGTPALREAIGAWFERRRGVPGVGLDTCIPSIGSKELVATLPWMLGLGTGDLVAHPHIAYPTYDVGARMARATPVPVDVRELIANPEATLPAGVAASDLDLLWINSPGNPHGDVLSVDEMRGVVEFARRHDIIVASDECYAELNWEAPEVVSVLDPRVCGGDFTGLLAVYSLSKQSNAAGYREGIVAGGAALISEIVEVRKHAGLILPGPIQAAMVAVLGDDQHVAAQRDLYAARRAELRPALEAAGGQISASQAGLYLWTTFGRPARETIDALAGLGILAAPGTFYGAAGAQHVRVALTASDERIAAAAERLRGSGQLI